MRSAKEIAEVFVTGIFQKTPGHWANRFTVENAIKRAQIEALEWAANQVNNWRLGESQVKHPDPWVRVMLEELKGDLDLKIKELKGEK